MVSSWQSVYDRAACPACGAPRGGPCLRRQGQTGVQASVPHTVRRRAATDLPTFSGTAARAAGWVPLSEVLDALRDNDSLLSWAAQHMVALVAIADPRQRAALADYLAERFGADTKETTNGR